MAGSSSGSSQNTSVSQSQSQSTTGVLDYPERAFLDSIAKYAGTVGQNVYNWAQDAYAKNSSLTDANISNYLNTSQQSLNQAGALKDQYNNQINPQINRQLNDADRYSSQTLQNLDMGAAESGQMQALDQALTNHKMDLRSFGIDPSSGRYAGLDEAARVQAAAAAVGAAQQARNFDVTTGQNLRQQGISNASQAAIAENAGLTNDYNTALQGYAGSENATLANANTGVALQGAANPFLQTAANYKPVVGTTSSSSSNSTSQGTSNNASQTTDPPQQSKDPSQQQQQPSSGSGGSGSGTGSGGSGSGSSGSQSSDAPFQEGDGSSVFDTGSGYSVGGYSEGSNYGDNGLGGTYGTTDPYSTAYGTDSIGGDYNPAGSDSLSGYNSGGFDYPMSSGSGASADGGGDTSYAQGGAIDDGDETGAIPQDGGAIPASASPSHGAVTDDVHAQLPSGKQINVNAREFVIPEDVARWKGEEFFQKLIAQSRQARVTAPAKPSMGQPQHG